jgi:hypothetical protein
MTEHARQALKERLASAITRAQAEGEASALEVPLRKFTVVRSG